jgi:RHS repeat-associated protein
MKAAFHSSTVWTIVYLLATGSALAADKNGVSPQVIALPSGPGSIQGLGESFQPQLNSGTGTFSVSIEVPSAATGFAPAISLEYHTGQGNGILGIGWRLSGPTMISRNMDHGLPFYIDGPNGVDDDFDGVIDNPEEIDRFSGLNLEELVPLIDGSFRAENEGRFARYRRFGDGWNVQEKNGLRHEFGTTGEARLEKDGRVFAWLQQRTADSNGNTAEYRYMTNADSPGQKYLREVRWAGPQALYAAVLSYDAQRPDIHADYKSGFEIRTGRRLARIDVIAQGMPPSPTALVGDFNEDGLPDSLIRRYELEYESNALVSRLVRVTRFGADGATALPSITFQYTNWTPPKEVALSFTLSTGDPSVGLNSVDVELIDMNQDGLPDLLNATPGFHRVHFNRGMNELGRLEWDTVGTLVGNAPGLNLGLPSVHLADHSADGESDFIHKVNASTIQCFLNGGNGSWSNPVNLGNTDTWPLWPFENADSRTLDTDHNRLHDILFTGENSYRLWMLMPGGRYGREVPLPVLSDGTQAFRFEDPGARIADVNGDRINDLVWIQSTQVVYWASCGRGAFDGPFFLPLDGSLLVPEVSRAGLADLNGDGLADLVLVRPFASPNGIQYFVNRGINGFDARRTILGLPPVQAGDATRWADMNGNGSVDFLISNSARDAGTREQFMDFAAGVRPNLLARIDNGLGSVTSLTYESSVDQMIRARDAGNPWETTMPFAVPVVSRITESDSRGNASTRTFAYRNPFFDSNKQEFRGFTRVEVREIGDASIPAKVTTTVFDSGVLASCRKGMPIGRVIADASGALFERMENTVNHRLIEDPLSGNHVCFAFHEAEDTFVYEQSENPVQVRAEYQFDDFGNVVQENRMGIVGELGDEQFVETVFAYDLVNWRLDLPSRSTIRDGNGVKASEDLFTYDTRGNLLEHRRWLSDGDRFVRAVRNEYDGFGNVIRMFDANGHGRSVVYDDTLHAFPLSEVIHLQTYDLTVSATYDLALGTVVSSLDFSGAQTEYRHDSLGRLVEVRRPGGARTTFEYEFGNPVSRVLTRRRESLKSDETFDSYDYFDGFGRKIGTKSEAEDGRWRFAGAVTFNDRKLARHQWLAYFTTTPGFEEPDPSKPHHEYSYDAQGRTVRRVNPDGTESRTGYEPLTLHRFDENDVAGPAKPTTERSDGLGRPVEVVERNGADEYRTRYKWSTLGDLLETLDAQGNRKTLMYDSLRRKTFMNDPDRGMVTFHYDDVGNLLSTTDARGQTIAYTYDFANRLLTENCLDQGGGADDPVDVRWVYDIPSSEVSFGDGSSGTAAFTGGRLAAVFDLSGELHFSFDARGNTEWTVKVIRDRLLGIPSAYRTGFAHDILDRLTDLYYPDNDRCHYTYNSASLLERIDGGLFGQAFITSIDYHPAELISRISFGNGVVTENQYDLRERLIALHAHSPFAGSLIRNGYAYDPASNVKRIDDLRSFEGPDGVPSDSARRNTQQFDYDDLHRLTNARYTPVSESDASLGTITYSYDAIGNMLSQTSDNARAHLGTMTYGGGRFGRLGRSPSDAPGPHALTATATGGAYEYDANGNMTRIDRATLTWDFKDRLVRYQGDGVNAQYVYDYANRRVSKLVNQDGRTDQTLYVNMYFEYRPNRAPVKYVFGGPTRIAQVTGTIDPQRPRLQRIWLFEGFNLVTVAVRSSQSVEELFGPGTRVFTWTGNQYKEVAPDAFVPVASPLWVEVPTARIVVALGMYEPSSDALTVPAGRHLLAWPRLEPMTPGIHLSAADARIQAHDPQRLHWFLSDPFLPLNVGDAVKAFDAASALWVSLPGQTQLLPGADDDRTTLFYHGDHLGSSNVITDRRGAMARERAHFPFGEERHAFEPEFRIRQPYGFTGKEQDEETMLHYFEARFLWTEVSRFLSPDPKYADPSMLSADDLSSFLSQPQKANLYSYVLNNPIRYNDPAGLEERPSNATQVSNVASDVSTAGSSFLEFLQFGAGAGSSNMSFAIHEAAGTGSSIATGAAVVSLLFEGMDLVKDPSTDKAVHFGGSAVITGGSFVSGPGAAIAGAARYTYENSPRIHDAANKAGDWAANRPGGSKVSGGIVAAEVSVGLTLVKLGAMVGGGQAGANGFDIALNWLLD